MISQSIHGVKSIKLDELTRWTHGDSITIHVETDHDKVYFTLFGDTGFAESIPQDLFRLIDDRREPTVVAA